MASDSEHRTLAVANAGAAVRVTLARPEKRNALSLELMSELIGVLQAIGERSDIRATVIEGSGVAFSAGHDLGEMVGRELPFYADGAAFAGDRAQTSSRDAADGRADLRCGGSGVGLVNRVVPASELDSAVDELVAWISRSSPLTVAIGKEAFYEQVELDEHRAYDLTKSVMTMNSMAADAQEGIAAFLEKRPPTWTGA